MTLLNWIKDRGRASPLLLSQINGLSALLVIGIFIYAAASVSHWHYGTPPAISHTEKNKGTIAVEISGETKLRGIYYIPADSDLASFLTAQGLRSAKDLPSHSAKKHLKDGTNVTISESGRVTLGDMAAATRLALGLPVDINKASEEDLVLIPGIKEATAEKILDFRKAAGGRINRMDDLMQINGIKEGRLRHLRQYLYVAAPLPM